MSQYIRKLGLGDLPGWLHKVWTFWPGAKLRTPKYETSADGSDTCVQIVAVELCVWSSDATELCVWSSDATELCVWSDDASQIVLNCE